MGTRAIAVLFHLTVGFALLHELDAMFRHEWRVLPGLSLLPDDIGRAVFLWGHLPFYLAFVRLATHRSARIRLWFAVIFGGFFVIHVGLHWAFSGHLHYEFHGLGSQLLILAAGLFGLPLAILSYAELKRAPLD